MPGFNWFDFVIIIMLLVGMAVGYSQGLIRQLIGIFALYVALVLAMQFFRALSQAAAGLLRVAPNTLSNMVAFFVIFFLALSLVNFLGRDAYKATRLRLAPLLDRISGMALGVASMWIILCVVVSVIVFAVSTQSWLQSDSIRQILANGVSGSQLAKLTDSTVSLVVLTVQPWLPGGLPALFNF
ncbi:CvpA family protein [Anaerolineae bacterium CFX7]|nr:CvpA family protein [Anaerolineae bacterium CFX7]